jgi:hypothetical protein
MKTLIKLLNFLFVCLFAVLITGCANSKKQKDSPQKIPGPTKNIVLQLPDLLINRNVAIQVHRLPSKEEKVKGIGEYRDDIVAVAARGRVKIRVPYGNYDIFVDTGGLNYGLLGVKVDEKTKVMKFSKEDLLQ